jgi:hypothetical protein
MIHFQDSNGELYGYELDGSQDDLIAAAVAAGMTEVADADLQDIRSQQATAAQTGIASVSMQSAQIALAEAGYWLQVEALVATQAPIVQIMWRTAARMHRNNAFVLGVAEQMALTDEQVDALFARAAVIDAQGVQ